DCCVETVAGAVYSPAASIVPTPVAGVIAHVTAVFAALATVAENCCVCPPYSVAVGGATVTDTGGLNVTVAVPVFVPSATLVAVIVTDCCVETVAGAVYNPAALIVPTPAGAIAHVTAVFAALATVAE